MTGMSALNNTLSLMIKTETVISKKGSWFFVFVVLSFSFSGSQDTLSCTVVVSNKLKTVNISNGFTYKSQLTPVITEVSPRRGGTAGGTSLTITGSGFRCRKLRHCLKSHPYYICVVHSQLLSQFPIWNLTCSAKNLYIKCNYKKYVVLWLCVCFSLCYICAS